MMDAHTMMVDDLKAGARQTDAEFYYQCVEHWVIEGVEICDPHHPCIGCCRTSGENKHGV